MKSNNNRMLSLLLMIVLTFLTRFQATAGEGTIAVDHVTGWPNLTVLPDGSFLLAGFDQASHGQVEGDVACWVSEDGGETWSEPRKLTSMPHGDGGYPASEETSEGRILTVYYSKKADQEDYAVFRLVWDLEGEKEAAEAGPAGGKEVGDVIFHVSVFLVHFFFAQGGEGATWMPTEDRHSCLSSPFQGQKLPLFPRQAGMPVFQYGLPGALG